MAVVDIPCDVQEVDGTASSGHSSTKPGRPHVTVGAIVVTGDDVTVLARHEGDRYDLVVLRTHLAARVRR